MLDAKEIFFWNFQVYFSSMGIVPFIPINYLAVALATKYDDL